MVNVIRLPPPPASPESYRPAVSLKKGLVKMTKLDHVGFIKSPHRRFNYRPIAESALQMRRLPRSDLEFYAPWE